VPLPSGGGTWPPQHLQPIYQHYNTLDAWYVGDQDRLAALYGDPRGTAAPANRPSQYRGGMVGTFARMFWGTPTPAGERRTKLHVPVASDICTMSSDLLFSEPPSITCENPQTQERIDELLPSLQATLLEGSEVGAALGGYYLRTVWDTEVAEKPWLAAVHADAAVPEFRWGRLYAVTFWRIIEQDDKTCYMHLERHEPGAILNALYVGEIGSLGKMVPLTLHAETAKMQPSIPTRLERCTAQYVPNMRPNRVWRNFPAGASLGRSDFDGPVLGMMDALDEVWTSWMRDIRIGKGRVHVPSSYLQSNGKGQGAHWDPDREIYEALNVLGGDDRMELTATQFAIRVVEHRDTSAELLANILRATGYSAQSFGLSGEVAVTATEVSAKERRSIITRGRKALYTAPELAEAIETLLELEASLGFEGAVTPELPTVVFGDSVSPDIMQLAQTAELMRRAEAASDETLVRLLHPDWDEEQIQAEVDAIADARPDPMEDPFALPGEMVGEDGEPVDPEDPKAKDPKAKAPPPPAREE
jgi:A118 family predicted phage portal protein